MIFKENKEKIHRKGAAKAVIIRVLLVIAGILCFILGMFCAMPVLSLFK